MKASATKGKASQLRRSHLAHRASGPTLSYLQTRIRGSRLYEAAFILAIVELTRRLHQAYAHAYDKQAVDWVLPQNPAPTPTPPLDCERFAGLVQGIANSTNSDGDFLDEMARTFTAANNSGIAEMRRAANNRMPAGRPTFTDSGFQTRFQDGSNQVRHFTAGFIAGARLGVVGLVGMNDREGGHNPAPGNAPDVRLNGVSTNLGSMFTKRPDAVEFRRASPHYS